MPKFRKKPVVIEATQWFKNGDHPEDDLTGAHGSEGKVVRYFRRPAGPGKQGKDMCEHCKSYILNEHGWIDTLEGGHKVCPGDFVITGVQGERYPCKPDIFEQTYDAL
jgi:hypothetical protein